MRRLASTAILIFSLTPLLPAAHRHLPRPQDPPDALADKLASPFLQRADWTLDLDIAQRRAAARKQLILGYFTTTGH